jgi:hypothetical protein
MPGNEKFDRDEIIRAYRKGTIKRPTSEPVILVVQDTAGVNYDGLRNMEGNGYISGKTTGLNIQTCLAVTPDGPALGVLDQRGYNRPDPRNETPMREQQKNRPIKEKESNRQLETMETRAVIFPRGKK